LGHLSHKTGFANLEDSDEDSDDVPEPTPMIVFPKPKPAPPQVKKTASKIELPPPVEVAPAAPKPAPPPAKPKAPEVAPTVRIAPKEKAPQPAPLPAHVAAHAPGRVGKAPTHKAPPPPPTAGAPAPKPAPPGVPPGQPSPPPPPVPTSASKASAKKEAAPPPKKAIAAKKEPAPKPAPPTPAQTVEELARMVSQIEGSAAASPVAPHVPGKKDNKPVGAKSAFSALVDDDSDDDLAAGLGRKKGQPQAKAKAKGSSSSTGAAPKGAPKAKAMQAPGGMNPLPQKPKASRGTPLDVWSGWAEANSASGPKWAERPVEKVQPGYYEEEEDPELAKYIWDRKRAAPKNDMASAARGSAKASGAGPKAAQAQRSLPPPPPQRQRQLLMKVMEMGFDESSARRALTSVGWSGVEDAVSVLLGG